MTRATLPGTLMIAAALSLAVGDAAVGDEMQLVQVQAEQFESEMSAGWELPTGWMRQAVTGGFALSIVAEQAGLSSNVKLAGEFDDVVAEGQFTFFGTDGMAQLVVRESSAGAYVATLDAAGNVLLEKRGREGEVLAFWQGKAETTKETTSARRLQLSALHAALCVSVDEVDVLTVDDESPLPGGSNKVGAAFATANGVLGFDDFAVWVPASNAVPAAMSDSYLPSGNDLFADRIIVQGVRDLHLANNSATTANEPQEPTPSNGTGISNTVWYEFTPSVSQEYLLTTFGSSIDTILGIYTGTGSLASLVEVASSDNPTGSLHASLKLALDAGQAYYIQLGSRNAPGDFEFRVAQPSDAIRPSTPVISSTATGAPSSPVANKGRTSNLQPVLAWAPRPTITPYIYLVELATTSNFASPVLSNTVLEPSRFWEVAPALGVPSLPAGRKYFWRVSAANFLGQASTPSPAYSFTLDTHPPLPPALTSPALNGVVPTLRTTLRWKAVSDAVRYRARVATNFSAATVFPGGEGETTSLAFTPGVVIPQGEYWYAVESRDAAGNWSGFGEKRRFVVNVSLSPANGARIIAKGPAYTSNVTFKWTSVPGAVYDLHVANDSSFSGAVVQVQGLDTSSHTLPNLALGTYFWRVYVNGLELPMSLARSFSVTPALPVAPVIQTVGPQPGAIGNKASTNDTTPMLDWTVPANWVTPALGASIPVYEVQLATNSTFTQGLTTFTGITDSHYELPPALANGTYFWRVRAMTNLQLPGAYSPVYRFIIDTQPPSPPQLLAPSLNGVVATIRPVIKWKAVADAKRYRARIATNFSGATLFPGAEAEGSSLVYVPGVDIPQGEYWFCVESQDAAGNWSGFGEKRRFVVNLSLAPANGQLFVLKSAPYTTDVTLTWAKIPGATYHVEVSRDSAFSISDIYGPLTTSSHKLIAMPPDTYYWRVRLNVAELPVSLARSFVITPSLPVAPLIQTNGAQAGAVTNNGVTNDTTPMLDWTVPANWVTPIVGASITYELQVAENSTFTQGASTVTGISFSHHEWTSPPLAPGTYFWRVRAVTNLGLRGAYSPTYKFTVE